jgi:hypothetical protein
VREEGKNWGKVLGKKTFLKILGKSVCFNAGQLVFEFFFFNKKNKNLPRGSRAGHQSDYS